MLKNPACLEPKPENLYFPPKKGDYVYFEGPPFQTPSGIHVANAAFAAEASMLAYARYGPVRMNESEFKQILRDAGFQITETIGDCFADNVAAARGYFAGNDQFAILAFRGTEVDNSHDRTVDLEAIPVSEEPLGGRSAGRVHWGFQSYLKSVWPRVSQLVRDYRAAHSSQEICITGHSLGGAIATLAFHQLQDGGMSLYTFGCPRVGNQAFCGSLTAIANGRACRIVDNEDVVTHIPLAGLLIGYAHPESTVFWIDANHNVIQDPPSLPSDIQDIQDLVMDYFKGKFSDPLPGPLADHSPVRYCHWLSE